MHRPMPVAVPVATMHVSFVQWAYNPSDDGDSEAASTPSVKMPPYAYASKSVADGSSTPIVVILFEGAFLARFPKMFPVPWGHKVIEGRVVDDFFCVP